jgi:hypothetical protein
LELVFALIGPLFFLSVFIAGLKTIADWVGPRPTRIGLCIVAFSIATGALWVPIGNLNVAVLFAFSLLLITRLISSLTGLGEQKARTNNEKFAYFTFAFCSTTVSFLALIYKDINPG